MAGDLEPSTVTCTTAIGACRAVRNEGLRGPQLVLTLAAVRIPENTSKLELSPGKVRCQGQELGACFGLPLSASVRRPGGPGQE